MPRTTSAARVLRRRALLAFCGLLCASAPAAGQARSVDASIGVWPWLVGNIDSYTAEIVDQAKRTGLDTLYLHVWRTTGPRAGEMRIVDEARRWNPADGKLIPQVTVSRFVQAAHAAGIQVVGVVQVFRSGSVYPSDYAHQDFMIQKVIRYLVHNYDSAGQRVYPFDGIALDYIRWFGGSHSPREVNRFLDELRLEVGPLPIHAYLPAGAYAIDGSSYNNTFRTYAAFQAYCIANYGQSWEDMARRIDCILPMAYTANGHVYGSNLSYMEGYLRQVALYSRTAVRNANSSCRIVPAIRTWNSSGQTTTQATVEACCRGAMRGGADGFMAFRYFTARGNTSWFQGLANHCQAGPDRPIAALTATLGGLQATVDTSGSWHVKHGPAQLVAHVDLDGDGMFETGPLPIGRRTLNLTRPGGRLVSVRVRDPAGHTAIATVQVAPADIFTPATSSLSLSRGGAVAMRLTPGSASIGQRYVVFCSLTGTKPGTPLGHLVVPLVVDPITTAVYRSNNTPMFLGFAGTINGLGFAAPRFTVPANAIPWIWAGTKLYFAAVGLDAKSGAALFASNPIVVTLAQ